MLPTYVIRDQPVEQLSSLEISLKVLQAAHLEDKMSQHPKDEDGLPDEDQSADDPRLKAYKEKYFAKLNECTLTHSSTILKVIRAVGFFLKNFKKYSWTSLFFCERFTFNTCEQGPVAFRGSIFGQILFYFFCQSFPMKWQRAKDVPSQILYYAGACQALWINQEVTFCESEVNEKGQRKSPFVPKQVLMDSFRSYLPDGGFFLLSS